MEKDNEKTVIGYINDNNTLVKRRCDLRSRFLGVLERVMMGGGLVVRSGIDFCSFYSKV